ncbi:MAG: hypothetical protein Q4B09_07405 [Lachnospiraceae bacterium]|nr:hypothetical protein [Lachnospiraceae bacterium]
MGKFCGKCGKPMEYCTCSSGAAETVKAPVIKAPEAVAKMKYSTVARVDNIALGEGEKKVREYTLGRYPLGCGNVSLIITNKLPVTYK